MLTVSVIVYVRLLKKYYPIWKIEKYGVKIPFLWGSISI